MSRLAQNFCASHAAAVVLIAAAAMAAGCQQRSARPTAGDATSGSGQAKYRAELLQSAMSLLDAPEQYDDEQQASQQIVERLNQWMRLTREIAGSEIAGSGAPAPAAGDSKAPAAQGPGVDALIREMPETFRRMPLLRELDGDVFDATYDGTFLREAALLRDVANHVPADGHDDLSLAQALFDWTVRNVQLEPQPADDASPEEQWQALHLPLETLYYGRATPLGRAWVFMLLARQAGLDVVLLALPDRRSAVADRRNPEQLRPWVTALVSDGQLYLFDHTYGLPIPGPGGKGIATLEQAAADDAVLRQMDIPGDRIYPRKAGDLEKVVALVEASPGYLASRMRLLEAQLTGRERIVLAVAPAELAGKLRGMKHVGEAKLWDLPYQTLLARASMTPQLQRAAALERMPFSIPAEPDRRSARSDERRRPRPVYALRLGRLLHLRGIYGGSDAQGRAGEPDAELSAIAERGAKYYYLQAMPTQEQLDDITRMQRQGTEIIPGRRLTKEFVDATEQMRDDAVYWMGLISSEQEAWKTAAQFFGPMTLEADPNGPWANGARFNLARAYEAQGRLPEAIKLYEADKSPQRYGNRLRAVHLKEKASTAPPAAASGKAAEAKR